MKKFPVIAYLNKDTHQKLDEIKAGFFEREGIKLNLSQYIAKLIIADHKRP